MIHPEHIDALMRAAAAKREREDNANEALRDPRAAAFEEACAKRSGITVQELRKHGRIVVQCDCGGSICEGWQSVNGSDCQQELEWRAAQRVPA